MADSSITTSFRASMPHSARSATRFGLDSSRRPRASGSTGCSMISARPPPSTNPRTAATSGSKYAVVGPATTSSVQSSGTPSSARLTSS